MQLCSALRPNQNGLPKSIDIAGIFSGWPVERPHESLVDSRVLHFQRGAPWRAGARIPHGSGRPAVAG
eukprot:1315643-Lingulodinium_polyedra.AAC.1